MGWREASEAQPRLASEAVAREPSTLLGPLPQAVLLQTPRLGGVLTLATCLKVTARQAIAVMTHLPVLSAGPRNCHRAVCLPSEAINDDI